MRTRTLVIAGFLSCLILVGAVFFFSSSHAPAKHAFYYWKTEWSTSAQTLDRLDSNHIDQLYLRFFDVEWNAVEKKAHPVAPLQFRSALPKQLEIIPVVFLVNRVFLETPYKDVEHLVDNVWMKLDGMAKAQGVAFAQIQIDCDWSDKSRKNYFHFADLLGRKLKAEHKTVSATIRLHQIKYADRTGIPPVSRGMLMFYNFGKIEAGSSHSAIFNPEDAARYTSFISSFPLALDVALPLFSWSVHSREGKVLGLLEKLNVSDIDSFTGFEKLSKNRYRASRSFFFHGSYFIKDDLLSVDETTPEMTRQAADMAREGAGWRKHYETVALFDLDDKQANTYSNSDIRSIFAAF